MPGFTDSTVSVRAKVPLKVGMNRDMQCEILSFNGLSDNKEHIALVFNSKTPQEDVPLVRIHSECLTGDVFRSSRCDCGAQLEESITTIGNLGGVIIYLRQEGRGIGLYNKLDAYQNQINGMDTFEANKAIGFADDLRSYLVAAEILKSINIYKIKLLSNNKEKEKELITHGIKVIKMISTNTYLTEDNFKYLKAKKTKYGHALDV